MALRPKQKAFCEHYASNGNATESAKLAGYSKKTARSIGDENLTKPDIQEYIKTLTQEKTDNRIADAIERQRFLTSVLRGEITDCHDENLGDIAKTKDRLDACKELSRLQGDYLKEESKDANMVDELKRLVDKLPD